MSDESSNPEVPDPNLDRTVLDSERRSPEFISETAAAPPPKIVGYELQEEIGRGGMGVVYRARHLKLKRDVALKVILAGSHAGPQLRERFEREAETIARLQHSGIVQIYEVGQDEGHLYLALELIEGGSLAEHLTAEPQPGDWSAAMVLQLAQAVECAHQQAVVHRDLKPSNVLVCESTDGSGSPAWSPRQRGRDAQPLCLPQVKITDFGLAKQTDTPDQLSHTGDALGTPAYMAPEQARGDSENISCTSDVYALGAILYELLTGQVPFEGDRAIDLIRAVLEDDPLPPRQLVRSVPKDLETICLKCLMKNPEDRYATAGELAEDLELFLQGEPIRARPLSPGRRLFRWARQRPYLAATYGGCLVLYAIHLALWRYPDSLHSDPRFHWYVTGLVFTWCLAATVMHRYFTRVEEDARGGYAMAALPIVGVTMAFASDQGPSSAPVFVYLLLIVGSALLAPRPKLIWFATGLSVACYGGLLIHAFAYRPENLGTTEKNAVFLVGLLAAGAEMHLLLRRSQRTFSSATTVLPSSRPN